MKRRVLSILAHPDDAEFLCAGTLTRLHDLGWEAHIASMTPGDCGSQNLSASEISRVRVEEARAAAAKIDGVYHCLDFRDLQLCYDAPHIRRTVELVREVNPEIVITHWPQDYMLDHEITSLLARSATFGASVPNFDTLTPAGAPPSGHIPHLYYASPIEGKNIFGQPVSFSLLIDISQAMETKTEMLACHSSQREWLRAQHGVDEYLEAMRRWSAELGARAGVRYAEGFGQHRGHAYPQEDVLQRLLCH
jgi:LmbE family N-acetylglucosaminyl deacetylase